jgi:hypothetical protein
MCVPYTEPADIASLEHQKPSSEQTLTCRLKHTTSTHIHAPPRLQELLSQLEAAGSECSMRLRRLDKKAEKPLLVSQKSRLLGLLGPEESPAAVLALALPLLVVKAAGKLVNTPGRAISGVLAALQPHLQEQEVELVQQYHALVVDSLKAQSAGSKGAGEEEQQQQQQQVEEQLAGLTPRLKALVGIEPAAASSGCNS